MHIFKITSELLVNFLNSLFGILGGNEGDHIETNADSGAEDDGNRRRKADENQVGHPVQKRSRQTSRPLLASVLVRPRTLAKGVVKVLEEFDVYFKEPPIVNEKGRFRFQSL